ncbi:GCN5-like protein 1-domain-containing protein [Syncephalis plumigaleata]|nr:GCN5-like protein 1-domain-containing protein [Syncephalis plumigaleata]
MIISGNIYLLDSDNFRLSFSSIQPALYLFLSTYYLFRMSAKLIKDHTHRQNQLRRDNEKRRKETVQALSNYTDALTETLNAGVGQVFSNERELRQHASQLDRQTARTIELTKQWLALSSKINGAVKVSVSSMNMQDYSVYTCIHYPLSIRNLVWYLIFARSLKEMLVNLPKPFVLPMNHHHYR